MNNYIRIGQFKKPFGVKGALRVTIDGAYQESFLKAEVLFVQEGGNPVPYFIESIEDGKGVFVKLEDVDVPETAKKLSNQAIFLKADAVETKAVVLDENLVGFQLIDEKLGRVGSISAIEEYPQQLMAIVNYKENEILIPLNEALIVEIDMPKKQIRMDLPEGLLEL